MNSKNIQDEIHQFIALLGSGLSGRLMVQLTTQNNTYADIFFPHNEEISEEISPVQIKSFALSKPVKLQWLSIYGGLYSNSEKLSKLMKVHSLPLVGARSIQVCLISDVRVFLFQYTLEFEVFREDFPQKLKLPFPFLSCSVVILMSWNKSYPENHSKILVEITVF